MTSVIYVDFISMLFFSTIGFGNRYLKMKILIKSFIHRNNERKLFIFSITIIMNY